jgi:hypothetical protein
MEGLRMPREAFARTLFWILWSISAFSVLVQIWEKWAVSGGFGLERWFEFTGLAVAVLVTLPAIRKGG